MKKIPTLFQRNYSTDRLVRDELTPGCEWVINGEGVATVKLDGTCCLVKNSTLFKRYELKRGKPLPVGFIAAQEPDPITGDIPGWIIVDKTNPEDKWHREAWNSYFTPLRDWTYELVGPKINGNPEDLPGHRLIAHGNSLLANVPRTFNQLRQYLQEHNWIEGIVWWRDVNDQNCDKVKLKLKDFGLKRIKEIK